MFSKQKVERLFSNRLFINELKVNLRLATITFMTHLMIVAPLYYHLCVLIDILLNFLLMS